MISACCAVRWCGQKDRVYFSEYPLKITQHRRLETAPLDDISNLLEERVFHVTKKIYMESILRDGEIKPNADKKLPTSFGHDGFFRNRNCVSLFDYRLALTDKIKDFRRRCSPFIPAQPESEGIAILLLSPKIFPELIPWTLWKEEKAFSEMVVPYVEAGYKGAIPTSMVEEIICLKLDEDPTCFAAILRRARQKANEE
jgi:hypothetical protein